MSVLVIDYGMGNLMSVRQAFEECGADVFISSNPEDIERASHIVLPGVGSFAEGMLNLDKSGWIPVIQRVAKEKQVPILGICLGMQLLADKGYEVKETNGLGIIPGVVKKLEKVNDSERIPHVGWNEIHKEIDDDLFDGIEDGADFYFVHSYHYVPDKKENILSVTPYCDEIVSSVILDNVYGVQFHPEKSQRVGFKMIENFLEK